MENEAEGIAMVVLWTMHSNSKPRGFTPAELEKASPSKKRLGSEVEGISCGIIMVQNVYVVIQWQTFSSLLLINERFKGDEEAENTIKEMIRERFVQSRNEGGSREIKTYGDGNSDGTKCIVMVAMDKYSYDPRKDFYRFHSEDDNCESD
ncbi:hypothetical protein Sjap_012073 [Stephania japonica]|uniref:Uncharacterized protein n=1 Tax=Stephania japonica TaxID=461633 RepID=A0AAP0P001_9MAGN